MPDNPDDRLAQTRVPIHPDIARRWSPRAFDPRAHITEHQIVALLEAGRWAATWGRRQPVRFIVGMRGDDTFVRLTAVLKRGNSYAQAAGALILLCSDEGPDEKTSLYSAVDAGAAMANIAIEAVSLSLHSHPMAGFDVDGARSAFDIPTGVRPLMVIAVGTLGDYAAVDAAIAERDAVPRQREPLTEVVFAGIWGNPFQI